MACQIVNNGHATLKDLYIERIGPIYLSNDFSDSREVLC